MIRALHTPMSRGAAWFLALVLVLPLVLTAPPAEAQSIRRIKQQRVVVLSITDITPRPAGEPVNQVLEQTCLDEIWRQLHENSHYQPVPTRDLERELENLQMTAPFRPVQQQMIAEALVADVVLTGYVLDGGVKLVGEKRQASVTVQVLLRDQLTGENVNGATVTQTSRIIPGDTRSDLELLNEAVEMAAIDAVRQMSGYEIPQGAVIMAQTGANIKINIGDRHGVEEDMEFILLRKVYDRGTGKVTFEAAGRLVVEEVYNTESECKAIGSTQTVQPEDTVRAIWVEEPLVPDEQNPKAASSQKDDDNSNTIKILLGAALVGLIAIVTVRAVRGNQVMRSVQTRTAQVLPRAAMLPGEAQISGDASASPRIRVSWPVPIAPSTEPSADRPYIVGYEVHRGTTPGFMPSDDTLQAVLLGGHQSEYVDDVTEPVSRVVALAPDASGRYITTDSKADAILVYSLTAQPVAAAAHYFYVIQALVKGLSDTGIEATRLYDIGPATALGSPSALQSRSASGELRDRVFEFGAAEGADTYVIQVSDTPTFAAERTLTSDLIEARAGQETIRSAFYGVDLSTALGESPVFWRVGAYRASETGPGGDGMAYSATRSISR